MHTFKNSFRGPVLALVASVTTLSTYAQQQTTEQCLLEKLLAADNRTTVQGLKEQCQDKKVSMQEIDRKTTDAPSEEPDSTPGIVSNRISTERALAFEPYVITPHKMNYLLPALTTNRINEEAYSVIDGFADNFEETEVKLQLSLKVPLNQEDIFFYGDGVFLGFTLEAWWQVYSSNISKPFRETNYQPELFYMTPTDWQPLGGNTVFVLGVEHQSNGRSQLVSRSWNRVYVNVLYELANFAFSLKPWWRIPEDDKASPLDFEGDDNPDITDFMGHFQLGMVYKWDDYELSFIGRQNFSEHKGAAEVGFTFPLWGKIRDYAMVFDGYGESLIDYNHSQTRFGLGIALTNLF